MNSLIGRIFVFQCVCNNCLTFWRKARHARNGFVDAEMQHLLALSLALASERTCVHAHKKNTPESNSSSVKIFLLCKKRNLDL